MADTLLDIVDENDQVIGQALRSEIHAKGLLHREIGVYYVTPSAEIIFQIRGSNVDRHPDRITAAAGGHVEQGFTHEQAALMEMFEETGVTATIDELNLLYISRKNESDTPSYTNNVIRKVYAYIYRGTVGDLKVEEGYGAGFISCAISDLLEPNDSIKQKFQHYATPERRGLYQQLQALVS